MIKFKLSLLLVYALINSTVIYSQQGNSKIESLIDKFLQNVEENPKSAYPYIIKATEECKKVNNSFLLSQCLYDQGYYHYLCKDDGAAQSYIYKSIPIAKQSKNYKTISQAYNLLGLIEMEKGNFSNSLKKFLFALSVAEKNSLSKNKSYILINLGNLYETQADTLKTLEYYQKSLDVALKNNFKDMQLANYNNIGLLLKKKNKTESLKYLNKAYPIAVEIKNQREQLNILINLSIVYVLKGGIEDYKNAYNCLQKAKKIAEQTKNEEGLYYVNFNLAHYYLKSNQIEKAIELYIKSLQLSEKGISQEQKLKILKALADAYKKTSNFEKANYFNEKYYSKKDSLFNIEKNKTFNEIQTKYEVEKKNLTINLLTKEKVIEQNRKNKIVYIGLSLILILTILLFFYRHRIKVQKIINEKEKELSNQEKELRRIQGLVEGQNQERNRIAREIHDGVGGKLAGIKLNLTQINSDLQNSKVDHVLTNFGNVFNEIRAISHNLSSNYINENSMNYLISELQNEYLERKEFNLEATIYPEKQLLNLDVEVKHQLYRIIQELLSNISKHANAKNASINITCHDDFLNIIIQDDGNGFKENTSKGVGLQNIRERLQLLNGQLEIEQSAQTGTTIIIDIPNQNLFKQND